MTEEQKIRNAVLDALIISTEAQLRALRRIRRQPEPEIPKRIRVGLSQVDLVEDILRAARENLHVNDIIDRVDKAHGVRLDRESIVSALTKKVKRGDRFVRPAKNTFGLKGGDE